MKHFKILALLLLTALLLGACQSAPPAVQKTTAAAAAAPATAPTAPDPGSGVSAGRNETFTYTDKSGARHEVTYQLPQLTFNTKDAHTVNHLIEERYAADFSAAAEQESKNAAPALAGISYQANVNDDVVTLVIQREEQSHAITYGVYNYNTATGEQLDNDGLLAYLQRDAEQTYRDLKKALESDYYAKYQAENFPEDYYYQLERTTGDEAVRACTFFLNSKGELFAVCKEYVSVGAGEFEVLISC